MRMGPGYPWVTGAHVMKDGLPAPSRAVTPPYSPDSCSLALSRSALSVVLGVGIEPWAPAIASGTVGLGTSWSTRRSQVPAPMSCVVQFMPTLAVLDAVGRSGHCLPLSPPCCGGVL